MRVNTHQLNRFLKKDCLQLKSLKIKKVCTVKEKNKWLQEIDLIKSELITSLNPVSQVSIMDFLQNILIFQLDHRTNLTLFGIEKMLLGELLDEFIDEYLKKVYQGKISMLLEEDQ